jgi:hypothetical protein
LAKPLPSTASAAGGPALFGAFIGTEDCCRAERQLPLRTAVRAAPELYDLKLRQIAQCDGAIETLLATLAGRRQPPARALLPARPRNQPSKNEPRLELRSRCSHHQSIKINSTASNSYGKEEITRRQDAD